jgi:SAM-dependent methyltransferase
MIDSLSNANPTAADSTESPSRVSGDAEWPSTTLYARHLADFHERVGDGYDDWCGGIRRRVAQRVVELSHPARGERVLDIGCGAGAVTGLLVERGAEVVGLDISPRMLDLARRRVGTAAHLMHGPAEALVFADATFDAVTMGDCLVYLRDPRTGLREACRVLRPGGRFALSTARRALATPAQELFFDHLRRLHRHHPVEVPQPPGDRARFGDADVLLRLLHDCGLADVGLETQVSGGRCASAREWTDLMMGAGPLPHALLAPMGEARRRRFEAELEAGMAGLGEDEAWLYHHAYVVAVALRPA